MPCRDHGQNQALAATQVLFVMASGAIIPMAFNQTFTFPEDDAYNVMSGYLSGKVNFMFEPFGGPLHLRHQSQSLFGWKIPIFMS